MAINKGKQLELIVFKSISELAKYNVDITRLYDVTMGYSNIRNPSDFIVYKEPTQYYVECKSIKGNTLNIKEIRQYPDLLKKSEIKGVKAGLLVWYIDHQKTFWVNIKQVKAIDLLGYKSLNIKDLLLWKDSELVKEVESRTPRVFPTYNFKKFFNII